MKRYLILFLLIQGCLTSFAQDSTYNTLLVKYNDNLDRFYKNLRKTDSSLLYVVLTNNEDLYGKLIEQDTGIAKKFFAAENLVLDSLNTDLEGKKLGFADKIKFIRNYNSNTEWYNTQYAAAVSTGLENCAACILSRKVRIAVMSRNNNKLDTLKCINVQYRKLGANNMQLGSGTLVSVPCPELESRLSTGPQYEFSFSYNNKPYSFKRAVTMGSTTTDVLTIPMVLEP